MITFPSTFRLQNQAYAVFLHRVKSSKVMLISLTILLGLGKLVQEKKIFPSAFFFHKELLFILDLLRKKSIERIHSHSSAKNYLGDRRTLRILFEQGKISKKLFNSHNDLMIENWKTLNGFLWRVEFNGNFLHLLGTCHIRICLDKDNSLLAPPRDRKNLTAWIKKIHTLSKDFLSPIVLKTFYDAECFVPEVDIRKIEVKKQMPPSVFSPPLWEDLYGLSPLPPVRPYGHEFFLFYSAYDCSKKIEPLEASSPKVSKRQFRMKKNELSFEALDALQWNQWSTFEKSWNDREGEADFYLKTRNQDMVQKIYRYLRQNVKALVAIGSDHFPGNNGILAKLQSLGAKIEFIPL